MPNFPRCDVSLLNDNDAPMEFVVIVLERFFEMPHGIAVAHMFRIHNVGKAICGTYSREEAEKKVADVLAFAAKPNIRPNVFLSKKTNGTAEDFCY